MTAEEFRSLALSLPEALEAAHMGHPDFRVRGKIFATLGPEEAWGMVKLTPEQQRQFVQADPEAFRPFKGAWGLRGCTQVCLEPATEGTVRQALIAAWRNTAPKRLSQQLEDEWQGETFHRRQLGKSARRNRKRGDGNPPPTGRRT